jgi:hypothetical protein
MMRLSKFRSGNGSSSICRFVMFAPITLLVVSTMGASDLTVTVSLTAATLRAKLTSACWPMNTRTPERTSVANPAEVTVNS